MSDQPGYKSYLLRLWQTASLDGVVWRASLEDARTGTRLGFSSLGRLHEFLLDQTADAQIGGQARSAEEPPSTDRGDDWP